MRGTVAKRLRRAAKKLTTGLPERRYSYFKTNRTTLINDPVSTRGVYRFMKKSPNDPKNNPAGE